MVFIYKIIALSEALKLYFFMGDKLLNLLFFSFFTSRECECIFVFSNRYLLFLHNNGRIFGSKQLNFFYPKVKFSHEDLFRLFGTQYQFSNDNDPLWVVSNNGTNITTKRWSHSELNANTMNFEEIIVNVCKFSVMVSIKMKLDTVYVESIISCQMDIFQRQKKKNFPYH